MIYELTNEKNIVRITESFYLKRKINLNYKIQAAIIRARRSIIFEFVLN